MDLGGVRLQPSSFGGDLRAVDLVDAPHELPPIDLLHIDAERHRAW
jgi:hypothetical protein